MKKCSIEAEIEAALQPQRIESVSQFVLGWIKALIEDHNTLLAREAAGQIGFANMREAMAKALGKQKDQLPGFEAIVVCMCMEMQDLRDKLHALSEPVTGGEILTFKNGPNWVACWTRKDAVAYGKTERAAVENLLHVISTGKVSPEPPPEDILKVWQSKHNREHHSEPTRG